MTIHKGEGQGAEIKISGEPTDPKRTADRKAEQLGDAFGTLLGARMGGTYAHYGEQNFSGDAASIFVMASILEDRQGKGTLLKIGWGEFSRQTFEGSQYPNFHNLPVDVYCVRQSDSYFADDNRRRQMQENPETYLRDNAIFVANNGKIEAAKRTDSSGLDKTHVLDHEVKTMPYDEMLLMIRNLIIETKTTPQQFSDFLRSLPQDHESLIRELWKIYNANYPEMKAGISSDPELSERKKMVSMLQGMGIVQHEWTNEVIDLISKFDFESKKFTSI